MKGSPGPRWPILLAAVAAIGCTQLKATSQPSVPTTPTASTASGEAEVPDPPAFESAEPSPTPTPTATPVPAAKIVFVSPSKDGDFAAESLDIAFTVTPPEGRTIVKASVLYDSAELTAFDGAGPSFLLKAWNPNVANNFGDEPNTTPVKSGDHKLVIVATDDKGQESRSELSFFKPLKITGWSEIAEMPQQTSHAIAFPDGAFPPSFLNVWGSIDGVVDSLVPRNQVYSFNPAGDGSWTEISVTGTAIPRGAYGAAMHPGGTVAYLVGGKVGATDLNTIDIFSPLRKVAEQSTLTMANPRRDPAVAYMDDHVYAIGGKRGDAALYSVERVAIGQDGNPEGAWESVADLQNARAGANAYVNGRQIWVFGGGFKPIEVYDARENEWTFLTGSGGTVIGTPEGWADSLMVPVGDRLFFFGGTREDGQAVDAVYEFSLKGKSWRRVGALPALETVADADRPETRMSGFYLDGHFYLLGGMSVPDGKVTKKVFRAETL